MRGSTCLLLTSSLLACLSAGSLVPTALAEPPDPAAAEPAVSAPAPAAADLGGAWAFWPASPVLRHSCTHRASFMLVEQQGSSLSMTWIAGGPVQGTRHLDDTDDWERSKGAMEGARVALQGQARGGTERRFETGDVTYELVYDPEQGLLVGQRNGREVTLVRVAIEEPDPLECGPDPE